MTGVEHRRGAQHGHMVEEARNGVWDEEGQWESNTTEQSRRKRIGLMIADATGKRAEWVSRCNNDIRCIK